MSNRRLVLIGSGIALLLPLARAQTGRSRVIGTLGNTQPGSGASDHFKVMLARMRELGWVEGRNLKIESVWADQHYERFPQLARDLVSRNVDLIVVVAGTTAAQAAKAASRTTPILLIGVADPVKSGLVETLNRPGGNVTGLTQPLANWGKFLELGVQAVPNARNVAVVANPTNLTYAAYVAENEAAARQLGLRLQMIPVASEDELPGAFDAMKSEHADLLVYGPDPLFLDKGTKIMQLARSGHLPVIGPNRQAAEWGALASYSIDYADLYQRAAEYADKLLRGASPAEMAMAQSDRVEVIVNLRSAKALGIEVPRALLVRASDVLD